MVGTAILKIIGVHKYFQTFLNINSVVGSEKFSFKTHIVNKLPLISHLKDDINSIKAHNIYFDIQKYREPKSKRDKQFLSLY